MDSTAITSAAPAVHQEPVRQRATQATAHRLRGQLGLAPWVDAPLLTNEAVVSVDLWKRANDALSNRPKQGLRTGKVNPPPLLANLKCDRCGSPMYRIHKSKRDKRFNYRCAGTGPNRKGCGNVIDLEALEALIVEHFSAWTKPHRTRQWAEGKNWDAQISDKSIEIAELAKNPSADRWLERMGELKTELDEYERKNREERTGGEWVFTDIRNADGSVMTKGQFFGSLDADGQREYLKSHDIRARKAGKGFVVMINGVTAGSERGVIVQRQDLGDANVSQDRTLVTPLDLILRAGYHPRSAGAGPFLSAQALTPRHLLRSRGRLPGEASERRVDEALLAARHGLHPRATRLPRA